MNACLQRIEMLVGGFAPLHFLVFVMFEVEHGAERFSMLVLGSELCWVANMRLVPFVVFVVGED